ncbi:Fe-S cluster assembly protein SufD [uncultured Thiodictyon sp.]|uniref:Fe-S cluster assembly protein SufD n=1 Tax=uncultured Thiodictyon sp. TaxID=1846217 RepID=UPI0025F9E3B7|nr:Fe-S cluster assembly protein SufD [uncultured Thiodictyon sp.]
MSPAPGFEQWLAPAPASAGGRLDWLQTQRAAARLSVAAQGVPGTKQEAWRYTSLSRLLEQGFVPAVEPVTLRPEALEPRLIPELDAYRVVLVNGRFVPGLSALEGLPPGVRVGSLAELLATDPDALKDRLNAVAGPDQSLFTALNTAGLDDGLVAIMGPGVCLPRPIELIHLSVGAAAPLLAQPRHLVVLETGAQAHLIERYVGLTDGLYCTNSVLEVMLGADAVLEHQRVQLESPKAFHLAALYVRLGAASNYRCINIAVGAAWARTDLRVRFTGEDAVCDLQGLYLVGERQLLDIHLDVDHQVPRCRSREYFKGILYGKGRAVFDGRVHVARDAQQTDAAMTNRNLVLCEGAEIDTKPQLEIEADDVKCSHGTTVGELDPEQLFYLRSRGIGAPLARRMLCLGFAAEVLDALGPEALRMHVAEEVGHRLEQAT